MALLAITIGGPMVFASPANAYALRGKGCRFDPKNDDDGLGIGINIESPYWNNNQDLGAQYAASDWNGKMKPKFTIVGYHSSKKDLGISWSFLGANVGAVTYHECGSDHYKTDPAIFWGIDATYYKTTQDRRVAIMVHEIGHAYGLAHNQTGGCNGAVGHAGLMFSDAVGKYNSCKWTNPTADDVAGATRAHNGKW